MGKMSASDESPRKTRSTGPTFEQAQAFCAVADASSYREAAKRLGLDEHVTLIRLVSRFTKTLGHGRLLEADSKDGVRLTPTGRRVLPVARGFMASALELREVRPEIRFSAYPTIAGWLAVRCPDLLEQDVPLVLQNISEANRQDGGWKLVHDVAAGRLDMAIAPAELEAEQLTERRLYKWNLRAIFPGERTDPTTRKLRKEGHVVPADLVDYRIAVAPIGHRSRELLSKAFEMDDVALGVALESPNQELLRAVAVGGNQHVAVIPDDAFGGRGNDILSAPALRVRVSRRHFGGQYALYMRKRERLPEEELSEQDRAISEAAERLVKSFEKHPALSPES